jgi:hypothetical protein
MADTVMRMPDPQSNSPAIISNRTHISRLSRKCTECEEDETSLHRSATNSSPTAVAPSVVHEMLRSPGQPLDASTRAFMEPRFGHDFRGVRLHTGTTAADSARAVNALAYTVGQNVVFGAAAYEPASAEGRRLLAHELTHTIQQGASTGETNKRISRWGYQPPGVTQYGSIRVSRVPCTSAAICSPPAAPTPSVVGSAEHFQTTEEAREVGPRERRKRMTPARAVSTGHGGRARQLEIFLNAEQPGRLANIQGIFIDHDLSPDTGAFTPPCADWIGFALPAGSPPPPGMSGAGGCTYVHGRLNQEALIFNTTTNAINGIPRAVWRAQTLQSLLHETEHPRFETATSGRALPAGVTSATCTRANVVTELSEIASILSEFPPISRAVTAEANPAGPLHTSLNTWFPYKMRTAGENVEGALTKMGCSCSCSEVDAFVADTFTEVTASGGWSAAERTAFNTRARTELPGPGRPRWPL